MIAREIEFVWLSLNAFASNITHEYKDNSIIPYIWLYFYPLYSSPVTPDRGTFLLIQVIFGYIYKWADIENVQK